MLYSGSWSLRGARPSMPPMPARPFQNRFYRLHDRDNSGYERVSTSADHGIDVAANEEKEDDMNGPLMVHSHIEITETMVRLYVFLAQALDRCLNEAARRTYPEQE